MGNLRVLLVENHGVVRAGLKIIIDSEVDMTVVGEADDGREGIRLAQELIPDVLIMDISMPVVNGLVCAATVKRRFPSIKILMLTRHRDKAYIRELFQAGISGYILKQSESAEMIGAIRVVASGGAYIDPAIVPNIFSTISIRKGTDRQENRDIELKESESEVLRRIALGYSNKEIAYGLGLSGKTIENQKKAALKKLDIKGRTEIVEYAIHRGWLSEE